MMVRNVEIQSVEQWNNIGAADADAVSCAQQLSQASLEYNSVRINFSGLQLDWDYFGARFRYREWPKSGGIIVGFCLSDSGNLKLCGEEVNFGAAYVVPSDGEADFVIANETQGLWMYLPLDCAEQMCLTTGRNLVKRVDKATLENFLATCRNATYNPGDWQSQILADLYAVLEPWRAITNDREVFSTASRHFKVFKQAEEIMTSTTLINTENINKIAETLGVSRRTLFQVFQSSIGIPPASYQRNRRLHALRDKLISTSVRTHTVAQLATSLGFNHLGRMHVDYHKQFGETPRATLVG